MNILKYLFITLAAFSTVILVYCISSIAFHGYERYLHDVAFYSLLGVIIGCVFGFMFDQSSQKTSSRNLEKIERVKVKRIPTKVDFKTKDGKTVSIEATKIVRDVEDSK